MPKGHSTLEPRIAELEVSRGTLEARIVVLERQITAMNDAFSRGNIPVPQYESQFKVWPGAHPSTNGS